MMLKNNFSSIDPEITVGIVMPSDNASNLELVLSESDLFELETDNKIYPSCKSLTELSIVIKHDKLHIPELNVSSQVISLIPTIDSHDASCESIVGIKDITWEDTFSSGICNLSCFITILSSVRLLHEG